MANTPRATPALSIENVRRHQPARSSKTNSPPYWADYVELSALLHPDGEVSQAGLLDERAEEEAASEEIDLSEEPSEHTDAEVNRVADIFQLLSSREERFGDAYPFEVSDDATTLSLKQARTWGRDLYVYLLLSSNLRVMDSSARQTLTWDFERLSKRYLLLAIPGLTELVLFHPRHRDVQGNFESRVQWLANQLGETSRIRPGTYPPTASGERGLDLVGWADPGDLAPGRPVVFAQCACGTNWKEKQREAGLETWRSRLTIRAPYWLFMLMPLDWRNVHGGWDNENELSSLVLIDRQRLLSGLGEIPDEEAFFRQHMSGSQDLIDQVRAAQSGLFE